MKTVFFKSLRLFVSSCVAHSAEHKLQNDADDDIDKQTKIKPARFSANCRKGNKSENALKLNRIEMRTEFFGIKLRVE